MVPSPRLFFPRFTRWSAALLLACTAGASMATPIYSCVDASGRRLTSDRPIPECSTREQRLLNSDGSVRRVVPPTMTAEEQAEAEARERRAAIERAARQDAIRRDRNLLSRFPDEATHRRAREAALDDVDKGVRFSENRLKELERERKPLLDEVEFYAGRQVPLKLRQQLDANEAATTAQRSLVQNQKDELLRIDRIYEEELARLKRLWAGAPPGSLGTLPTATPAVRKDASR
ncbi:DUF4124 domain-containing protein [Rhizobacter sp. LjRoot28]|jgi:hypothetical protein|uniref:DUF4124 domain-containing protein n=1 Tax=Rhizobacter sp. LjRoot28 TaxID=3342309 RepID=UPI003ECE6C2D